MNEREKEKNRIKASIKRSNGAEISKMYIDYFKKYLIPESAEKPVQTSPYTTKPVLDPTKIFDGELPLYGTN